MPIRASLPVSVAAFCLLCCGLAGCARTVYVADVDRRPLEGVKVTLTNRRGTTTAVTQANGYAKISRATASAPGQLTLEKEGYTTLTHPYPGGLSFIEMLHPAKPAESSTTQPTGSETKPSQP